MAVNLQYERACRLCTSSRCVNCPTQDEPLCYTIDGREYEVTECPNRYVGDKIRRLVRDADRVKDGGALAVSGGYYEQPAAYIAGLELVWSEQENVRRELRANGQEH